MKSSPHTTTLHHTTRTARIPTTAILFVLIAPITTFYYATYVFNVRNAGVTELYILQLIADSISMITVGTLWITILLDMLQPEHNRRDILLDPTWITKSKPTIDVLVPVTSEPYDIIENTLQHVADITYPHTTYVLDDAGRADIKELTEKLKMTYLSRPKDHTKRFAKSGNLNFGLQHAKGDYFAVFDADHAPKKDFITSLLPFFINKKIAVVQTPQYYTNTHEFIAQGTAYAQDIFYTYVQPAKNSFNAAFCVGTNMIYRRKAIDDIGGIAKQNHSEDIWTTILLHERGWESLFDSRILAEGKAPSTLQAFIRQQNRLARGGFTLFFHKNPLFIESLTLDQRLQYAFSNFHYFSGISILIYLFLPIISLFTGMQPMTQMQSNAWLTHYVPFALIVYLLPYLLLKRIAVSMYATSLVSFIPYISAFISVVFKNKYEWVATEGKSSKEAPFIMTIWPIYLYLFLAAGSLLVGWYNPSDMGTVIMSSVWTCIHGYFLIQSLIHSKGASTL